VNLKGLSPATMLLITSAIGSSHTIDILKPEQKCFRMRFSKEITKLYQKEERIIHVKLEEKGFAHADRKFFQQMKISSKKLLSKVF